MIQNLLPLADSPLPWLGVSANEAVIRNLSLILEDIAESVTKAITGQQKISRLSNKSCS